MTIELNIESVHIHMADSQVLQRTLQLVEQIHGRIMEMSQEMQDLETQVGESNTVVQSAITLLQGLKQKLDEAGTDKAKLKALRDSLDGSEQALAEAVAKNTPADPNAPPAEEPTTPPGDDTANPPQA